MRQKAYMMYLRKLNIKTAKHYKKVARVLRKEKQKGNLFKLWKQTFLTLQILVYITNKIHELNHK